MRVICHKMNSYLSANVEKLADKKSQISIDNNKLKISF